MSSSPCAASRSRCLADGASIRPGIASAAYRVVQESLTNVMRHAGPGAEATVAVTREGGDLTVEVTDTGGGSGAAQPSRPPGHGVIGMRERVLGLGGRFSAGPEPGGGFRVSARLPAASGAP